jgi:hypothetical protein
LIARRAAAIAVVSRPFDSDRAVPGGASWFRSPCAFQVSQRLRFALVVKEYRSCLVECLWVLNFTECVNIFYKFVVCKEIII